MNFDILRLAVGGLILAMGLQVVTVQAETAAGQPSLILVESFEPEGNTLISDKALEALFERYIGVWPIPADEGVRISPAKLRTFLEAVLNFYLRLGHSGVYVYIPQESIASQAPLSLRGNELILKIVEGRVKDFSASYKVQRRWRPWRAAEEQSAGSALPMPSEEKRASWVRRWNPIKVNEFVQKKQLEDFVDFLERHPGRSAAALVRKSEAPAAVEVIGRDVAIDLRVLDMSPMTFYIQFNNTGSESTEENRISVGFINNNLFGRDDIFNLNVQVAAAKELAENYSAFLSYNTPLWNPWWRFEIQAAYSEFESADILGAGTPFLGEGFVVGGELSFNLWQRNGWFLDLFETAELQNSKLQTPFGFDSDLNLLDVGAGIRLENNKGPYIAAYEAEFSYNLTDLLSLSPELDFTNSRFGAESGYYLFSLSGRHQRKLWQALTFFQNFGASYSPDRLVSAREISIGGLNTVRGYEEFEVLGDYGFFLSTEPRFSLNSFFSNWKLPVNADLIPLFFDIGSVWTNDTVAGEDAKKTIYSVGSGARFYLDDFFFARFYWGYALKKAGDDIAEGGDTQDGDSRIHFDLSFRF